MSVEEEFEDAAAPPLSPSCPEEGSEEDAEEEGSEAYSVRRAVVFPRLGAASPSLAPPPAPATAWLSSADLRHRKNFALEELTALVDAMQKTKAGTNLPGAGSTAPAASHMCSAAAMAAACAEKEGVC